MPGAGPAAATIETVISMLERLGSVLDGAGWTTRLQIAPGRAPSLHVQNPAAPQLSETIRAAPKNEGLWFWWSWAEPIGQDPAATAAIILRALRARPEADPPRRRLP
jgi:hypothetical protein